MATKFLQTKVGLLDGKILRQGQSSTGRMNHRKDPNRKI